LRKAGPLWHPRSMRHLAGLVALIPMLGACHRGADARIRLSDVEGCEQGIERAGLEPNLRDAMRTYLTSCSLVYAEPACRQAVARAASADRREHPSIIVPPCRLAYCPLLADQHLVACQPEIGSDMAALAKTWPALNNAILAYDAKGYAPRLVLVMWRFYVTTLHWSNHEDTPLGAPSATTTISPGQAGTVTTPVKARVSTNQAAP
jgi:hypothetical protein